MKRLFLLLLTVCALGLFAPCVLAAEDATALLSVIDKIRLYSLLSWQII